MEPDVLVCAEFVEWRVHQALRWECKTEGPASSHPVSHLLTETSDVSTIDVALSCLASSS